jgi:hypothetical protein
MARDWMAAAAAEMVRKPPARSRSKKPKSDPNAISVRR